MSTTRLFDQDAYLGEFEATVERSVCEGGMYRVLLDQTAFFPEGGNHSLDTPEDYTIGLEALKDIVRKYEEAMR